MDYQSPDDLYNLLPAVYRIRDAEKGYPLRAFMRLISGQVKIVKEDIDRLWDNFFIETCEDWVIPYIGDLVANNPLHDIDRPNRADVAKTIYYRRRKGTLPMLEELARDVTGWGCHAVEFFQLLGWTQNLNHLRLHSKACPDVRDLNTMDLINTPFDSVSHNIDVRAINQTEGWYNIKNIGFFLWRLKSYPLENISARPVNEISKEGCYHFSPLGNPAPLFHNPLREGDETGLAGEIHVSGPIRPTAFYYDLESYYGEGKSLYISGIEAENIICKNLQNWQRPPSGKVAVDVKLGRLAFAEGEKPDDVTVSYHYGFSAEIGGGQYERRHTLTDPNLADWNKTVSQTDPEADYVSLSDALSAWSNPSDGNKANAIITITDNATYTENIAIELSTDGWLVIQAENGNRPTLRFEDDAGQLSELTITGGDSANAALTLNGLLIEGGIHIEADSLGQLELIHSTLVPGRALDEEGQPVFPDLASIIVENSNTSLEIEIDYCIAGALRLPDDMTKLTVKGSILDAFNNTVIARIGTDNEAGPPTILEQTTVLGEVYVKELILASEVIFTQSVMVEHTQTGCVRFSYIAEGSRTPRRFRCQPDMALKTRAKELERDLTPDEKTFILAWLKPGFTSENYGHPAYGQLSYHCPDQIKTGAEDGSEMGAFAHLKQPQREANLRIRLNEYLPFGLKPGLIYVT